MRLDRGSVGVFNSHLGHPHLFCGIIEGLGPDPTHGLCHYGKETPAIVVNGCLGRNLYLETVVNVRNYRINKPGAVRWVEYANNEINETPLGTCPTRCCYFVVATPLNSLISFCGLGVFELPYELGCGSHHTSNVYRCPQCASQETHSYQKSLPDPCPFAYDITAPWSSSKLTKRSSSNRI